MTKREAKILALSMIWGQATMLCDKNDDDLSDRLGEDVMDNRCTEEEALIIMDQLKYESDLIWNKLSKLRSL